MISEPPPQNPWISYDNHIPNPQDCQWGARLTVSAKFVTIVNPPEPDIETDDESDSDSDYGDEEEHIEFMDYVALGRTPPRHETPLPVTPVTAEDHHESFVAEESARDEGREFASFLGDSSPLRTDETSPDCDEMTRTDYEVLDDDDDDLPPFDDWYTGIQSRMQSS